MTTDRVAARIGSSSPSGGSTAARRRAALDEEDDRTVRQTPGQNVETPRIMQATGPQVDNSFENLQPDLLMAAAELADRAGPAV